MAATAKQYGLSNLLTELKDDVGKADRAAWVIDPDASLLFPVNTAGRQLFGASTDDDDAIALDSAMPAITTLRRIARTPRRNRAADKPHWLLFWTDEGPKRHLCYVRTHSYDHGTLCLVVSAKEQQPAPRPASDTTGNETERDDAATLREIARQIRAGTAAPKQDDPKTQIIPGLKRRRPPPPATEAPNTGQNQGAVTPYASNTNDAPQASRRSPAQPSNPTAPGLPQLAQLAHELRTPIAAILSAAEILKDERLGALDNFRYRGYARDIYQSADNALTLLNRTFESFRPPDESTQPQAPETGHRARAIDLNLVVEHCHATVSHLVVKKALHMDVGLFEAPILVAADKVIVSQILLNLLTNAIKFTPRGGTILVRVDRTQDDGATIEVEDTGRGMTDSEMQQYLDPQTAVAPGWRKGGGLGIGLTLSRTLAERIAATLTLDSQPNVGTKAVLTFSAAHTHQD